MLQAAGMRGMQRQEGKLTGCGWGARGGTWKGQVHGGTRWGRPSRQKGGTGRLWAMAIRSKWQRQRIWGEGCGNVVWIHEVSRSASVITHRGF